MRVVISLKKIVKIITCLLAFLIVGATLAGCTNVRKRANGQDNWKKIEKKKKVVIGLDDSFVPMGFREKDGSLVGFDVDLAREVFKRYGIDVDFQTIDWSMKETELRNGTIDLIWNGYTVNPERKKTVAFSVPYLRNQQVLVSKKKENVYDAKSMKGKALGLQSGSSGYESYMSQPKLLKNYVKEAVQYDTFNNAFLDLNANRIQRLLIDSVYADYYVAHEPDPNSYRISDVGFESENFAVGMRKGDKTLQKKINVALAQMAKDGTLQKISNKWFGTTKMVPLKEIENQKID